MAQKNKFLLICSLGLFIGTNNLEAQAQAVGISAQTAFVPNPSSILDISSTTKGILIPRLTNTERAALQNSFSVAPATPAGANGLMIYNTTTSKFNYWDGAKWNDVGAGSAAIPYWWFGTGNPPTDPATNVSYLGAPNDYYYDNNTGRLFRKNSDHKWSVVKTNQTDEPVIFKNISKTITETDPVLSVSIPVNGVAKRTFPVVGALVGAAVSVSPAVDLEDGIVISYARVISDGIVEVKFTNAFQSPKNLTINGARYFISVVN